MYLDLLNECLAITLRWSHDNRKTYIIDLRLSSNIIGFDESYWCDWKCGYFQDRTRRGHSGTEGVAPALRISRKKGSFFKTYACPRFCKRRVLFCTQVRSMGVKIPLQSTKYTRLWRRVTPEVTGLPSLLPPLAAAKQVEDYKILS